MAEPDLKSCPFCGGPAEYIGEEDSGYNVQCKHCLAKGGWGDYGYQASAAWNRRPSPPAPDQTNAEVSDERLRKPSLYAEIIAIVNDCSERMKRSGESHRMFAKWVSEGVNALLARRSVTSQASEGAEPIYWEMKPPPSDTTVSGYNGDWRRASKEIAEHYREKGWAVRALYASPSKRVERLETANRALAEIKESFRIAGLGTIGAHWQSLIDAIDQALQGDHS